MIQDFYLDLLAAGWALSEIDNLDLPRWLSIQRRALERKHKPPAAPVRPIDTVRW